MKNTKLIILVGAAAVVALAVFLLMRSGKKDYIAKEVDLKLNLTAGQSVKLRRTQRVDIKEKKLMGISFDYKLELDYTITCKSVKPDGTMFVEQRWDAGRLEGSGRKGDLKWDSTKGAQIVPQQAKLYSKLVGKSIELEVTPSGEVLEIWGLEVIADALLYQAGIRPGNDLTEEEYMDYQKMKVEELKNTLEYVLDPVIDGYPEQPIQPGDTLDVIDTGIITSSLGSGMKLIYKGLYEQNACFEVAMTVTGSAGSPIRIAAAEEERQEKREGKGEIEVNAQTGLIVGAEVTFNYDIHRKIYDVLLQKRKEETLEGEIAIIIKRL